MATWASYRLTEKLLSIWRNIIRSGGGCSYSFKIFLSHLSLSLYDDDDDNDDVLGWETFTFFTIKDTKILEELPPLPLSLPSRITRFTDFHLKSIYISVLFTTKFIAKLRSFTEIYICCDFNTANFLVEIKGREWLGVCSFLSNTDSDERPKSSFQTCCRVLVD
jgi:hypothetical protein